MRLFLDSIGCSDLSAKKIKKWMPEDRRQFELIQERWVMIIMNVKHFTVVSFVLVLDCAIFF